MAAGRLSSLLLLCLACFFCRGVSGSNNVKAVHSFTSPQLFPESFDWDGEHNRFLLGSTTTGCLTAVSGDGFLLGSTTTECLTAVSGDGASHVETFVCDEDYAGKFAVLGVKVDSNWKRVVVVVNNVNPQTPPFHAVAAYDLDSKERTLYALLHTVGIAEGEESVANDVAVDDDGNLYVTNTKANFIWKVDKESKASVFVRPPVFTSQPIIVEGPVETLGLNGIVYHDHGFLLVVQSNSGSLFKVELSDLHTSKLPTDVPLPAGDGMRLREDGLLVVVSRETAWLLATQTDWGSASVVDQVQLNVTSFTTSAAIRGRRTFLLQTFIGDMFRGLPRDEFAIQEIQFSHDLDDPSGLIITLVGSALAVLAWRWHMGNFSKNYQKRRDVKIAPRKRAVKID